MKKFAVIAFLMLGFVFGYAIIAGISGKWTGSLQTPDGNSIPVSYIFKADSGKLSGTLIGPDGELPLSDGKLNGNDFTFNADANGKIITGVCKYYPTADTIAIDMDFGGLKLHSTLKRDK